MKTINIGIFGLGTVGQAVALVLQKNSSVMAEHCDLQIKVKAGCDLRKGNFHFPVSAAPDIILNDPDITVVVETMGGVNPAKKYVLAALKAGKHVVTSNKELVATHMDELLAAAAAGRVAFLFEGAVGGGIPILNTLRNSLAANHLTEVFGIVNGTTNYILSKMTEDRLEFSQALQAAQAKGFAEADPKLDVEGYDAAFKAAILSAVAFDARVKPQVVYREGIDKITAEDVSYAGEIGYVIKLLAGARRADGKFDVRVHPALVAKTHPLAGVSENFNAIYVKGFPVGELMFYGPGAGGNATASAVIGDIIAAANDKCQMTNVKLMNPKIQNIAEIISRYYIRLRVLDKPGVLAGISKVFAGRKVSIAAVNQKETVGKSVPLVILTHDVAERHLLAAIKSIRKLPDVKEVGNVIRIL